MIPPITGLFISFVGTLLVAFSVRKGKVVIWKDSPKEPENPARFNVWMFRWGLALLALGFLLQIWGVSLG